MPKDALLKQAISYFEELLGEAHHSTLKEPSAATLATASRTGAVTSRTVLLKYVDIHGFVFFTNLGSRKGKQIKANPRGSLCFYWDPLLQQVTVDGRLDKLPDEIADYYWSTRTRDAQISAWASLQSEPLPSRDKLLRRVAEYEKKFNYEPISRPPFWSGFCLKPDRIEFWKKGENRLHERIVYERVGKRWKSGLLYP